jgi:hydrogenase expression/formation protein HypC
MCLAIPGKIIEIYEEDGLRMGRLDFGGLVRKACLQYIPDAEVGHYALIHVGFALAKIEADEAARTYALLASLGDIEAELSGDAVDVLSSREMPP